MDQAMTERLDQLEARLAALETLPEDIAELRADFTEFRRVLEHHLKTCPGTRPRPSGPTPGG
jgi:uncharacterized coiled-coil protein SlyX